MDGMIPNKKWLADQILSVSDNNYMKAHFYNLLYMMCISRFIWKNVPNNIDVDFIERELANNGELAFINHPIYGFQVTHCMGDYINMYGRPTKYLCWTANNVINDWFKAEDIVIIKNNKLSQSSRDFIDRYASIIAEIQKVKEVNLNSLKTPIMLECDENEYLTAKNMYAQYEGNEPVIFKKPATKLEESLKVWKTDAPYLLDKLQTEKMDNFNECLNFMGIKTVSDKKERMFTKEVEANNDLVNICLSMFLSTRLQAIEEINEKFNLNEKIEIELAEFCKYEIEEKVIKDNNGGDENEQV